MNDTATDHSGALPHGTVKGLIIIAIAAAIGFLLYYTLPYETTANKGLALLFFVAVLWFSEATHITITALLVPIIAVAIGLVAKNPATGDMVPLTITKALSTFANPTIYLFFGGFAMATALHIQKLDKKIAMWLISLSGSHLGVATVAICAVTAFLSMWISNTATAAMMLPLALGMLSHLDQENDRNTFVFILLSIAYSASIGGLGTVVGSPPNAIAAAALNLDFTGWMKIGLPFMLVLLPLMLVVLYLVFRPNVNRKVALATEDIPWNTTRILTMILFILTAIAWIFGKKITQLTGIPLSNSLVALIAAVTIVILGLATWKEVARGTEWGVLLLFGGGLTLSAILKDSGASLVLGQEVARIFGTAPPVVIIAIVALFIIILTEFTSNTASAALLVPVFATIADQVGLPKEVLVMVIGIGASCAFMLPVATPPNAVVFGTGLVTQREMMKAGVYLSTVSVLLITAYTYLFLM